MSAKRKPHSPGMQEYADFGCFVLEQLREDGIEDGERLRAMTREAAKHGFGIEDTQADEDGRWLAPIPQVEVRLHQEDLDAIRQQDEAEAQRMRQLEERQEVRDENRRLGQ